MRVTQPHGSYRRTSERNQAWYPCPTPKAREEMRPMHKSKAHHTPINAEKSTSHLPPEQNNWQNHSTSPWQSGSILAKSLHDGTDILYQNPDWECHRLSELPPMASTHGYVESTRHGKEKNSHGHKQTEGLRVFNSIEDYQWHTGCFRKYLRKHTPIVRLVAIAFY